ncbi:hypothetical protein KS4_36000 [Poriferisphaera corsica]|uniref:Phage major capsid protein n=1 Tax=Poriferisphaera corsica TaxID=2528020 RepID=A0A517YZ69_9BACT|nr:DUF5309 family protein [Poriferisphaera corsica]QDU35517.1 hypothetical protein KS4_36000 [Poriferisphaera corsica]
MAFTGKATFSAGAQLPEIAEDISDVVSIVSPYETALLNYLGDSKQVATSTIHEWLEDELRSYSTKISTAVNDSATQIDVEDVQVFRIGDLLRAQDSQEVMMVQNKSSSTITVARGYGGSLSAPYVQNTKLLKIGSAALEGEDAPSSLNVNRIRKTNFTQIFTAAVEVSGSHLACNTVGITDELDYQKQERLREMMRDLENSVINGIAAQASPQGSSTIRRTMQGIIPALKTNVFDVEDSQLTESRLNEALRVIWEQSAGNVDTIVVNGFQKRMINRFVSEGRGYGANETKFSDYVGVYESDFGICRVIMSRWVPRNSALMLDSSRVAVVPMSGRSFHYKPLASQGDYESGQLIGEYTLELRNENAHGLLTNLAID